MIDKHQFRRTEVRQMGQIEHKREPTTTFVPTATSVSQALTRDRFFLATIAVLVILLAFIVLFPLRTASDVALYIDGGGRVLDGQRPYIDFFDI
ncbi:MAG: hypothetical protein KC519_05215, partial [Anaerolineae bacterium]|nr:hypothetical protein [Anaerolineae bacterium]